MALIRTLGEVYFYLRLRKAERWGRERLEEEQLSSLRHVVETAKETGFYQHHWQEDVEIQGLEDVEKLPYTDRNDLKQNPVEDFLTGEKPGYEADSTGGTSGRPLKIYHLKKQEDFFSGLFLRAIKKAGAGLTDRMAYYWYRDFDSRLYNRFILQKDRYTPESGPREHLEKILETEPDVLVFYPGILYELVKLMEERGIEMQPELVVLNSELVTPHTYRYIDSFFECPVQDQYGLTETGQAAWGNPEDGYRIEEESVLPEFRETSQGDELVLTSLVKDGMPIIRYRTGDIVENHHKEDGRTYLTRFLGRRDSFIEGFPPGELVDPVLENSPRTKFVQLVKDGDLLEVRYRGKKPDISELRDRLETTVTCSGQEIYTTQTGSRPVVTEI